MLFQEARTVGASLTSEGKMFRAGQCQVQETRTRITVSSKGVLKKSTSLFHATYKQDPELLTAKPNWY